jgi:hypothetical protein
MHSDGQFRSTLGAGCGRARRGEKNCRVGCADGRCVRRQDVGDSGSRLLSGCARRNMYRKKAHVCAVVRLTMYPTRKAASDGVLPGSRHCRRGYVGELSHTRHRGLVRGVAPYCLRCRGCQTRRCPSDSDTTHTPWRPPPRPVRPYAPPPSYGLADMSQQAIRPRTANRHAASRREAAQPRPSAPLREAPCATVSSAAAAQRRRETRSRASRMALRSSATPWPTSSRTSCSCS